MSERSTLIGGHQVREFRPRDLDQERAVPLLFIHGGCHGGWCWESWQRHLAALGWHSYAVTLPGHDPDDPMPPEELIRLNLNDYACAVEDVLAQMPADPVVIGHSMGGVIAQIVASRNPVVRLVLVSSGKLQAQRPHHPPVPADVPFVLTRESARTMLFHDISDQHFDEIFAKLVPESPAAMNDYPVGGVIDASTIECRVLVIAPEFDRDVSLALAADTLTAYDASGIRVLGAGHDMIVEAGTEFVASYLHCWLEQECSGRIEPF